MVERLRVAAGMVFSFSVLVFSLLASKKTTATKSEGGGGKESEERKKHHALVRPFLEPLCPPSLRAALERDTPSEALRGQRRAAEKR